MSHGMSAMKLRRRQLLRLAAGAVALPVLSRIAKAQTYPTGPVRLVVGFPPGGPTDIVARLVGQWLSERLRQPFVVENRSGAASNIATEAVIKSRPDGYTLLLAASANAINATIYDKLNFNFIEDIAPVAGIMRQPFVICVNPSVLTMSVPGFMAYASANPGKVNMASAGNGSPHHVFGELFMAMTGIKMLHVPYRGEAPALTDLLSGRVEVMFASVSGTFEYIRAGTLRPLAVTTRTRSRMLPDIPTVGDFVPGFEASAWVGIGAPKNTPADIINKLNNEINRGLADPTIEARLADLGGTVLAGSPAEFGRLIADDTKKWAKVVSLVGIKPE
jgi:tripartite-type tricarboxylate transporter receptor subunit TctC